MHLAQCFFNHHHHHHHSSFNVDGTYLVTFGCVCVCVFIDPMHLRVHIRRVVHYLTCALSHHIQLTTCHVLCEGESWSLVSVDLCTCLYMRRVGRRAYISGESLMAKQFQVSPFWRSLSLYIYIFLIIHPSCQVHYNRKNKSNLGLHKCSILDYHWPI